jgi:hypothetical protein
MSNECFTFQEDEATRKQLTIHMRIITEEILRTFKRVDSIILAGGFGRGEGTIRREASGKVIPFKDYDIFVISDGTISDYQHLDLIQRIYKQLGIRFEQYYSVGPGHFSVQIQMIPFHKLERLPPDISAVDLKLASRIIYGRDVRNAIHLTAEDTAIASGAIVLLNKVTGLLENMSISYFDKPPLGEKREALLYECAKTFVEICTALLILKRRYIPSYLERALTFEKIYADSFPELRDILPDLPTKVQFYTDMKLRSNIGKMSDDPLDLWFRTREYFGIVLRYYMREFLSIDSQFVTWSQFADSMYQRAGFVFFHEFLDSDLKHFGWYHPAMLPWISFLGQTYDNVSFVKKLLKVKKQLYMTPVLFWRSPMLKVFTASLLALYSLRRNGSWDQAMLKRAEHYLRQTYPVSSRSSDPWTHIRSACVEAQKTCLIKTQKAVL